MTNTVTKKLRYLRGQGFLAPPRRERRAYPQRSVRSEQRRRSQTDRPPRRLRRVWVRALLLLGHRSLRTGSLLAPRQNPNPTQRRYRNCFVTVLAEFANQLP